MKNTSVRSVRRPLNRPPGHKRIIAVLATLAVFGAAVSVTQISNAGTESCDPARALSASSTDGRGTAMKLAAATIHEHGGGQQDNDTPQQDNDTQQQDNDGQEQGQDNDNCEPNSGAPAGDQGNPGAPAGDQGNPAAEALGDNCDASGLDAHDGFQNGDRCVGIEFGEVAAAERNPSLLITRAPRSVRANEPFTLRVSTRNLVRDRFLPAAEGGYYKESSFLNEDGLTRGHFHTACRMLTSNRNAPDPEPPPAFFVATEDGNGGAEPDEVTVNVPGLAEPGQAQCAVWAGDGSHRMPMMERANQIPAFDVARITVE